MELYPSTNINKVAEPIATMENKFNSVYFIAQILAQ